MNANMTTAGCPVARATAIDAFRVDAGVVESVEVELRAREVDGGVEPERQLLVRERVDERRRLGAMSSPPPRPCRKGRRPTRAGQRRWRSAADRRAAWRARAHAGPGLDLLELHPVDAVERELDHQRSGFWRVGVLEACPAPASGDRTRPRGGRGDARRRRRRSSAEHAARLRPRERGRWSPAARSALPRSARRWLTLRRARAGARRARRRGRRRRAVGARPRTSVPRSPARDGQPRCRLRAASRPPPRRPAVPRARRGVRVPLGRHRAAASASAHRSCAPRRHPPGVDSYTARRTSGCRKRKRRGTSVSRIDVEAEQLVYGFERRRTVRAPPQPSRAPGRRDRRRPPRPAARAARRPGGARALPPARRQPAAVPAGPRAKCLRRRP